jgi:hypothetical protein
MSLESYYGLLYKGLKKRGFLEYEYLHQKLILKYADRNDKVSVVSFY